MDQNDAIGLAAEAQRERDLADAIEQHRPDDARVSRARAERIERALAEQH